MTTPTEPGHTVAARALERCARSRPSAELAPLAPDGGDHGDEASPLPAGFVLPMFESNSDAVLSDVVPCSWACGAEYCSPFCRDEALKRHHALFCPAPGAVSAAAAAAAAVGAPHAPDDGVNAAALFSRQALSTNEIFILAGRLIARVLEGWARNENDLTLAMAPINVLHSEPWPSLFEIRTDATERKRVLMGLTESDEDEEVVGEAAMEDEDEGDEEHGAEAEEEECPHEAHASEAAMVREWAADSLSILRALVKSRLPLFVSVTCAGKTPTRQYLLPWEEDMLLSPEVYERLVGAFELNNIEVKIDSPLREYLGAAARSDAGAATLAPIFTKLQEARIARRALTRKIASEVGTDPAELLDDADADSEYETEDEDDGDGGAECGDDEEDVCTFKGADNVARDFKLSHIPVSDGTALFSMICVMNHSCLPNVQVAYGSGTHVGSLLALRDIKPGEELFINYVDKTNPEPIREQDLRHYGFRCMCQKCTSEREMQDA